MLRRLREPLPAEKMKTKRTKQEVREEAFEDLVVEGVQRLPVVRDVKDSYDILNDLEKLRSGEDKPLIDKILDR